MTSEPKSIPFIVKNPQTQTYEITLEAQEFLKTINNPLSIISVAGLYRTGKSYLLNRAILNKNSGFNVGPTINPCTKGLLIWNQPIYTQDNKTVLVIDTQGLGALDEQSNHDMKIFSLAVLLSTTFIYNSVGSIDENALQTLSLVLNIINNIDQQQKSSKPSFIWVVRDFSLQLVDQKGNTITPKQYLEMALNYNITKQSQKVEIRKNITNAFNERDCFTIYKPLIDENKLQNLDKVSNQQLRPEFLYQISQLRKKIFTTLKEIKLSDQNRLKGPEYLIMIKQYLNAINGGKVPSMVDTWTFIKSQKARQVTQQIIANYNQKIKQKIFSKLPIKICYMEQILKNLWTEMITEFKQAAYDQTEYEQLQVYYERMKTQIKAVNEEQMKNFLKNLLTKQFQAFSKKLYSNYYDSMENFVSDIQKNFKQHLISTYYEKVDGLNASISSFLEKKFTQVFKYFGSKMKYEIKVLTQNKEEIQNSLKKELDQQQRHSHSYQNELKGKITELDKQVIELTRIQEEKDKYILSEKQFKQNKDNQIKGKLEHLQQDYNELKNQCNEFLNEKNKLEKQNFMIKKSYDKQIALLNQKYEYLSAQKQEQNSKNEDMKKLLEQKMNFYEQQKRRFLSSNQDRTKLILVQNQQKSEKIYELQSKIIEMKQQFNEKLKKYEHRESKLVEEREQMKQNLINDFSNRKQTQQHQIHSLRQQCRKYEDQFEIICYQKTQLQNKLKQLQQELNHIRYSSQKQIAIHLQKIQFQDIQIKQLKFNHDEIKRNYQVMIENLHSSTRNSDDKHHVKFTQMSEQYQNNIKSLQKQYVDKIYELKKQLQSIKTAKQNVQIQFSLERKKFESKQKQIKDSYSRLQGMYKTLNEKLVSSQKDYYDLSQQKEGYFTLRIKQLQKEVQQVKQKARREIEESQRGSEEAVVVLKNYTQMERQQWEKRVVDEREKGNKKVQGLKEDYEKKHQQQKQMYEQQLSLLQQKVYQTQKYASETLQNMKYDHEIQIQKLSNQFMQQKLQANKKNALLTQQVQLTKLSMTTQMDQLRRAGQQALQRVKRQLQSQLQQQRMKYKQERDFIQGKYESLKRSNKTVEQQNLVLKSELDKQKAVYRQKETTWMRNVNDLESRLSHELMNHTKIIEQISFANNQERKRLNAEIDGLKGQKSRLQQQKSMLQIQKDAIESKTSSKLNYLETKLKTNKADYDDLMTKFELTSNFLNKKIGELKNQKAAVQAKVKVQFEQQISIKQDSLKKQTKQYNDRIYRLQTQNKSLRDKVILLQVKLASECKMQTQNGEFEQMQMMRQEYGKRQEQYRRLIQKLKKQNKLLKQQKQVFEATSNYDKSRSQAQWKERDSIINGLNENSRDYGRSRVVDGSKLINTSNLQMNGTHSRVLAENKSLINRKSVSPLVTNKKSKNYPDEYSNSRLY